MKKADKQEDEYTEALSRIIGRDFFPDLPHLRATNAYLSSLASNDAEGLSASIRQLARIAQDKDEGRSSWTSDAERRASQREREREEMRQQFDSTPRINLGQRGWDTPLDRGDRGERGHGSSRWRARSVERNPEPGPSRKERRVRDDLSLDAFQRNYTSEDNAAFASILDSENADRRARNQLVWDFERVQEDRRLEGEAKRKAILDAAQSGWMVDGEGRRMIGGLARGSRERGEGEGDAWAERKLLTGPTRGTTESAETEESTEQEAGKGERGALVKRTEAGALVKAGESSKLREKLLPETHPLSRALEMAGLPPTAITDKDGAIVPARDLASGSGDGRGRGLSDRQALKAAEKAALGSETREGGNVQQWKYKAMNGLMFPPDSYTSPYPPPPSASAPSSATARKGPAPSVAYRNTRLDGDEEEKGPAPSTSYASSWVDRAVRGKRRRPSISTSASDAASTALGADSDDEEEDNAKKYDLVDEEPDLEPEELPLMTYGSLLATPKRVSTDDDDGPTFDDGPSFRFPEEKKRDEIGRKLGNKAGKAISDRARMYAPSTPKGSSALKAAASRTIMGSAGRSGGSMGPPSTRGNLTPAAQALLQRTMGRTPLRSGLRGGDSVFKSKVGGMGWSPSPRR